MILSRADLEENQPELNVGDVLNLGNKDEFYMVISANGSDNYALLNLNSGFLQYMGEDSDGGLKLFVSSLARMSKLLGTYTKVSGNFNAYIGE